MLFSTPPLAAYGPALAELADLQSRLGAQVSQATPWVGRLRRQARAATARSSVAIEGFSVSQKEAEAIVKGQTVAAGQDQRAFAGYALAMQHVAVLAEDPTFGWSQRLLLDLHFETCSSDPKGKPGLLRTGPIYVTAPGGGVAYRGPSADELPELLASLVAELEAASDDALVVVRAAMAHLNLVSIHPFNDGNGRLSRIIQSLLLARAGVLSPEFGSIEEYLARDTLRYYEVLREVQGGSYQPERSAEPWVAFCIEAHLVQARERISTLNRAADRWAVLEELVAARGWPERLAIALEQSLFGGVDRASYTEEADVSPATASADLRRLVDAGFLEAKGKGRKTRYLAAASLSGLVGPR